MTDGRLRGARTSRLQLIEHDTGIAEITVLRSNMPIVPAATTSSLS
ncbi:hypothetical protein [uncultured Microbacterium sp.]|nr:hypothetical protein [uncultured Microbacterium sp.]